MSSLLVKALQPRQIFHLTKFLSAVPIKNAGHFAPDYKPGPYPRTKEEREAAARKYNLLPEEYEPYPEDDLHSGDYPMLEQETVDAKDSYYNWDCPQLRRNYMDPVPREMTILTPESASSKKELIPRRFATTMGFVLFGGLFLIVLFLDQFIVLNPVTEKQYPFKDVKHYTFEKIKRKEPVIVEPPPNKTGRKILKPPFTPGRK